MRLRYKDEIRAILPQGRTAPENLRKRGVFLKYDFLIHLAIILISTKVLGMLTRRIALPQVVGALIAGILLGPAAFGIVQDTSFIDQLAELGVIVLMFTAGMETDIQALKKSGKTSFVVALIGVLFPLVLGFGTALLFNKGPDTFWQNAFVGVVLTATSVSITVETLREMGKLSTNSGNIILGAALIDDVLGIIILTVATSMAGEGANVGVVLLKIVAFFAISLLVGFLGHKLIDKWFSRYDQDKRRFLIVAFALCLVWSYVAEEGFGVADITGAYIIGVMFAGTPRVAYLENRFDTMANLLLSPVFFASIGLKVVLPEMSTSILIFSLLLTVVAIASKVVGCGLGARLCGCDGQDSLRIGVGMISRGEVALIVANQGLRGGLMKEEFFGPLVLVVIITTVVTPILLKFVYKGKEKDYSDLKESELVNKYEDAQALDQATQILLDAHNEFQENAGKKADK